MSVELDDDDDDDDTLYCGDNKGFEEVDERMSVRRTR